ncbi:hypothetical protein [Paraburkholderia sediminicola]|uniref:hypothetical protein n=1 Tax=Paraburkholderia sediminicola TaxID=458836 RepID=UPI0038BCD007
MNAEKAQENLTLVTVRHANAAFVWVLSNVHGEICHDVHRLPAGKTAAERGAHDVVQVRQRNCQKIDDINYARRHSFI